MRGLPATIELWALHGMAFAQELPGQAGTSVATGNIVPTQYDHSQWPHRKLAICPQPQLAFYSGGDPIRADGFSCRTPAQRRGS